jgi:hypothetical protein
VSINAGKRLFAVSVAAVTFLGLVAGCGDGASSGQAPNRHSEKPSTSGANTGTIESGIAANSAESRAEAGGARVQRTIPGQIHRDRSGDHGVRAKDDEKKVKSRDGGRGGLSILDQLRRVARERLNALAHMNQGRSGQDGVPHVLEMLR